MKVRDRRADAILARIQKAFDLTEAELAELFKVRRSSVAGWRERGIPKARVASVERVRDLAAVLKREVLPSRIPEIVRTPDKWLGNRTILQTIHNEGAEAVYAYLHRLFAYNG